MKYSELMSKLEKARALKNHFIDCVNNTITIEYKASTISDETTKTTYNMTMSKELKDLMKFTGETKLDRFCGIAIKDINDNSVEIYPYLNVNYGKFVSWKAYNNFYLIHDENIIIKNPHITNNCIYCASLVEKAIGIYKDCLIATYGNHICAIDKKGNIVEICHIPEPEDGREDHLRINIKDNTLNVNVYCYYDNDWHHGGWEENEYNLDEIILAFKKSIILRTLKEYLKENSKDYHDNDLNVYSYKNIDLNRYSNDAELYLYYTIRKRNRSYLRYPSTNSDKLNIIVEEKNGELIIIEKGESLIKFFNFSKRNADDTIKEINNIYKKYI